MISYVIYTFNFVRVQKALSYYILKNEIKYCVRDLIDIQLGLIGIAREGVIRDSELTV